MATFAYAPDIRVHVFSTNNGILDISNDLANWEVVRRSNAVSTFNFTLQNPERKYDGVFRPGDQITVELKRLTWCRVFTGTLNVTPVYSAYPRALPMSASCTLKKLQFWPWDPSTTAATALLGDWHAGNTKSTILGDGGLSGLLRNSLVKVSAWNPQGIHIGEVPDTWFRWAQDVEKRIDLVSNMAAVLGSASTINGTPSTGAIVLPAGNYGGEDFSQEQLNNAMLIYAAVLGYSGLTTIADQDLAAQYCIMTAITESSLINNPTMVNHTSVGLYQQQLADGWGDSVSQLTDVVWSTKAFLGLNGPGRPLGLFNKVPDWRTHVTMGDACQIVQGSAFPDRYENVRVVAQLIVAAGRKQFILQTQGTNGEFNPTTGIPTGNLPNSNPSTSMPSVKFADQAYGLVTQHPNIPYDASRGISWFINVVQPAIPTYIDCSGLVDWAYFHSVGASLGADNSGDQYALCQTAGLDIPIDKAQYIQGALLFRTDGGRAGDGHVAISLGNGTVADAGASPLSVQKVSDETWNVAGLLPDLDYSSACTDDATLTWLKQKFPTQNWSKSTAIIGSSVIPTGASTIDQPFRQLINALAINPAVGGDIYGGSRQYIHTQPFLPWVKNLCNSSMRAFCSAPNGDFMAWFPDYFGVFGTAGIMKIEPIELMDFTVDWSDQQIVTHEFVTGTQVSILDQASGQVVDASTPDWANSLSLISTHGIATMDFPEIFRAIWGKPATTAFIKDYLTRFGVRPNVEQMPNINTGPQEFFIALWNFMFYWASQFTATIPMTFMPEIYPGMLIRIPQLNFQAYVVEVEHSGSYGQGGKFTTNAKVVAPARLNANSNTFGGIDFLPVVSTDTVQ